MKIKALTLSIAFLLLASVAEAQTSQIYDPQTGQYLGDLSANQFAPNSTGNPFGRYGSQFSQDSINNPFGPYGSPFSNKSATNPYATNPPVVVHPDPMDMNTGQVFQGMMLPEW